MKVARIARISGVIVLMLAVSGCFWAPDLDRVRKDIERQIPGAKFDREIALSLGPIALTLVRGALSLAPDTHDASGYVSDIRSVGVAVYTARDLPADFEVRLPEALEKLIEKNGWELAVRTREGGEAVWILCKQDGESVRGIYVVALDDEELVLVRAQGRLEEMFKRAIRENAGPGELARGIRAELADA